MVEDDNVLTKKPIGMKLSKRDILQVLIIFVVRGCSHITSAKMEGS